MKDTYPKYIGRMGELEDNISNQDKETLKQYINFCSLNAGQDKVQQRKRYIIQFIDIAEVSFNDFNREVIEHIHRLIKATNREIAGKNETIKQLRFFIKWKFPTMSEELLKGIRLIPQRNGYNTTKINPSTLPIKEEIEKMIRACAINPKKVLMISLQTELALRPCEVLALKFGDIKIEGEIGEIKIYSSKTRELRVLPFKTSVPTFLKWKSVYPYPDIKDNDLLFPHPYIRQKQLYRTYLSQLYKQLCKETGLRHIYPYLIRHAKLTHINKNCPSKVSAKYGGHSVKTAGIYTHLSEADIREVILKNIYDIKEPDIKKRKELEKEILRLRKEFLLSLARSNLILETTAKAIETKNPKILRKLINKLK